ncbi:MAG: PH domain-containing protein [bacterium]
MNPQSVLQQQFPLSPRKFWKKMVPKIIGFIFLPLIFLGIIGPFFFFTSGTQTTNLGILLLIIIVSSLILYLILILPYAWYVKVYIKRYYYDAGENFITIKKGVFAPTEIHVQWQKIQDVYVDQDILDRIMGLYDVHIASATATSGIEAHIDGVNQASAEGLKKILLDKVSGTGKIPSKILEQTQTPQPNTSTITLNEDISNNTYPLTDKWTMVTLISRLIGSFVLPAFIIFIFFGRAKDISFADYWIYFVLGWLALSVLTMIVRTITLYIWKSNYAFNFTPEHIYYREGVISMSEKHMPYSSIQDVTVKQSVIERLFGLAKVVIENAAQQQTVPTRNGRQIVGFAGILIQGLSLADANKITDIVKTTVLGKNNSRYGL